MTSKKILFKICKRIKNLPKDIYRKIESKGYNDNIYSNIIKIMTPEDSVKYLAENLVSFCRFGDGEIAIMRGESIAFQKADDMLSKRLKEILRSDIEGLKIGVNYLYMNPYQGVNEYTKKFLNTLAMQRKFMIKNCNKNITYIDAGITQLYQNYEMFDFDNHFKTMQEIFRGKDITLVCGKSILNNIKYNPLDVCNSVEYIYEPSINAFSEYDKILKRVLNVNKNRIICVILGPAAKVLVYDLHIRGHIACDIGHYIKDYDSYMRKQVINPESIEAFFKPD
jgi:glycosyltransferase family protein